MIVETPTRTMHANMRNRLVRGHCQQYRHRIHPHPVIVPELIPIVFGDGKQIIAIQPIQTGRHYYVLAVDSEWSLTEPTPYDSKIRGHLDAIYDEIRDWFGYCNCHACDEDTVVDGPGDDPEQYWPAPCLDVGSYWWPL